MTLDYGRGKLNLVKKRPNNNEVSVLIIKNIWP